MKSSRFLLILLFLVPLRLEASCGSSSCPIDLHALDQWKQKQFTLDLSFQYIDQDQPRIGTRRAAVGALPSDHAEVRTVNRLTTLQLGYRPTYRLQLALALPYVSRAHEHIDELNGPERWNLAGSGDVALHARYALFGRPETRALSLIGAIKFPTGAGHQLNRSGEQAEITLQPGSGSVDGIVGVTYQGSMIADTRLEGPLGNATRIPYFASVTFRRNGAGANDYRRGDEVQISAGTEYPLSRAMTAMLQVNARRLAEDSVGTSGEDPAFTGGRYLFLSPGLRVPLARGVAAYGIVQLPVYQKVNGLQLTPHANYLLGFQTRF